MIIKTTKSEKETVKKLLTYFQNKYKMQQVFIITLAVDTIYKLKKPLIEQVIKNTLLRKPDDIKDETISIWIPTPGIENHIAYGFQFIQTLTETRLNQSDTLIIALKCLKKTEITNKRLAEIKQLQLDLKKSMSRLKEKLID